MPTVLLAEADRELRDAYQWFLSHRGFQVETADNGLDCLAKLRRLVPDLLILDLELPWGGGDGVLSFVRENPRLLPKRVVLTSAVASPDVLGCLASPPAVQVVTKPFPLSALLEGAASVASDASKPRSNGEQPRAILVVDDDHAVLTVLQTHLQREGFHVWTAGNGEEALDHCCDHGNDIAVVLLDVQLPGLDGPQTLEGIQALEMDIPVCFMTGNPGRYEPDDLLRRGARHLFGKPFDLEEVARVVRHLADKSVGQLQEN
jgi:CheY-like chemotaxis protein